MTHALFFKRSIVVVISGTFVGVAAMVMSAKAQDGRPASQYTVRTLPLPDNGTGDLSMDYMAFDPATNRLWVPDSKAGAVDVVDVATGNVRQIRNLPIFYKAGDRGGPRVLGPFGASLGDSVVYIGNESDSSVCAFHARSLAPVGCALLNRGAVKAWPKDIAYVAPTKEVWVTMPVEHPIRVLDASTLRLKATLMFPGSPEGHAVDAKRGRFYTNVVYIEGVAEANSNRTIAIDLKTHATAANWNPACGGPPYARSPRGLVLDEAAGHLFIGCDAVAKVMNVDGDGTVISQVDAGFGVEDIAYVPAAHLLYVGAGRAAKLTIARAEAGGKLITVAQVPIPNGARNAVVTTDGTVYLAPRQYIGPGDGGRPALVVVSPAR